jgi:hypothetical protein
MKVGEGGEEQAHQLFHALRPRGHARGWVVVNVIGVHQLIHGAHVLAIEHLANKASE